MDCKRELLWSWETFSRSRTMPFNLEIINLEVEEHELRVRIQGLPFPCTSCVNLAKLLGSSVVWFLHP